MALVVRDLVLRRRASAARRRRACARPAASSVCSAGGCRQLGEHELDDRGGDAARGRVAACRPPCRRARASCRRRPGRARPRRRRGRRGRRRTAPGARRSRASGSGRRPRARRRAPSSRARRSARSPSIVERDHVASPSSSGKCASRLRIGAGMPPPWAHRLPSSSVSSSCLELRAVDRLRRRRTSRARGAARSGTGSTCRSSRRRRSAAGAGDVAHVGALVEGDDPAVADHAALGGERRRSRRPCRAWSRAGCPPSGPPICSALIALAVGQAAGDVLAQLAHRHPERDLVDAGPGEALVEADELACPGSRLGAERAVGVGAVARR